MAGFKPSVPFCTPLLLFIPTYTKVAAVNKKSYPAEGILFFGSFKTYGGTDVNINGVYSVEDTAVIECWYRPDVKSDCRVVAADTGAVYEIYGEPENIEMRNQYLRFKIKRVKGGA